MPGRVWKTKALLCCCGVTPPTVCGAFGLRKTPRTNTIITALPMAGGSKSATKLIRKQKSHVLSLPMGGKEEPCLST